MLKSKKEKVSHTPQWHNGQVGQASNEYCLYTDRAVDRMMDTRQSQVEEKLYATIKELKADSQEKDTRIRELETELAMTKPLIKVRIQYSLGSDVWEEVVECHACLELEQRHFRAELANGSVVAEFYDVVSVIKASE